MVPKVGCTAPWGELGLPRGAVRGKGRYGAAGGLEVGLSERAVRLYTIQVILDQTTLGNWYHLHQAHLPY
jgi:hypothetical protein